jgi:hypothetical protein
LGSFGVLGKPCFDARPGCVFGQFLIKQPTANALIRLLIGTRKGQANLFATAIRLSKPQPARALNVQNHGVDRVGNESDFFAFECVLGSRQGGNFFACKPG